MFVAHAGSMHVHPSAVGARILVVDDEPYITEMLSLSLRFVGFEVAAATAAGRRGRRVPPSNPTSSCST